MSQKFHQKRSKNPSTPTIFQVNLRQNDGIDTELHAISTSRYSVQILCQILFQIRFLLMFRKNIFLA